MLRTHHLVLMLVLPLLGWIGAPPAASAKEGQAKPEFQLRDTSGAVHRLSAYRGKWVVLEWVDFSCPTVQAMYQAPGRKMQRLQQTYRAKGVVWLAVHSTGAGQAGHMTAAQAKAAAGRQGAQPNAFLLDPTGAVGKAFGVRVAPEARVLNPKGDIAYAGGVERVVNGAVVRCLDTVLTAATGGKPIPYVSQPAVGCPVRYASTGPAATGPKAPNFALRDSRGVTRRLSDYRGKWVILEWVNYDCPYVKKHYHSSHRNMQRLQAQAARHGIVWFTICSSAPGKQGHFTPAQVNARMRQLGAVPAAYLLDPTGAVGHSFRAQRTPGIRIISPQGTVEYSGGADSIVSSRASDVPKAKNHIAAALADIVARRPIRTRSTRAYGCSVKYRPR